MNGLQMFYNYIIKNIDKFDILGEHLMNAWGALVVTRKMVGNHWIKAWNSLFELIACMGWSIKLV